jgi:hypothetical protein
MPQNLVLNSWTSTTTSESFGTGRLALSYNLTRSIANIFKGEDSFINNWSDLTQSDNVIDGYIKKTVLNYYNITKAKIKVNIWTKPYTGGISRLAYSLDDTFSKWEGANIDGVLNYINNESDNTQILAHFSHNSLTRALDTKSVFEFGKGHFLLVFRAKARWRRNIETRKASHCCEARNCAKE